MAKRPTQKKIPKKTRRASRFRRHTSGPTREKRDALIKEIQGVPGFSGAGIGDGHLTVYATDKNVKKLIERQIGAAVFRGCPVKVEVTGALKALID